MAIDRQEALTRAEERANEIDLDFPTRKRQAVYDELTRETPWGWLFYYTTHEDVWVTGRDPEAGDNPPIAVVRSTGEVISLAPGEDVEQRIAALLERAP